MQNRYVVAALIAGATLRVAVLRVGVPAVDDSWRAWSYHAATQGPARMYGPRGHTVKFDDIDAPVVYPPLALGELGIIGRVYMTATRGRFSNDVGLTIAIKSAIALLDAILTALLFLVVRRAAGVRAAWWGALAYWLNPAVLMATTLGYIDVFLAIPSVGALVAASYGRPWLAGALFTAAAATKPQGLFIAPAAALALRNAEAGLKTRATSATPALKRLGAAAAGSVIAAAVIVAPLVAAGTLFYMVRSVAVLAGHNMLSALAFNLWWIVSYLFEAAAASGRGLGAALGAHPSVLPHAYAIERGFPNPRLVAVLLVGATVVWALRTTIRARDLGLQAALAAFIVDAYFTLSVQVHENHFFLVLPLLALASALRREFAPVLAALSVAFALNLYLMLGVDGNGPPGLAITFTGVDSTVLLSIVNCALCAWFAVTLRRASRRAASVTTSPMRSSRPVLDSSRGTR